MAKELMALRPELVLGMGTGTVRALQRENVAIPIVFIGVPDPIGAGFVASLARPGGYLTGTLLNEPGVVGKWLAMLKEFTPQIARTAVLFNPRTSPYHSAYEATAEAAARSLGIQLVVCEVASVPAISTRALSRFCAHAESGADDPAGFHGRAPTVISLSNWPQSYRLPAVYHCELLGQGGRADVIRSRPRRCTSASGRLRRSYPQGEKPADLPVKHPRNIEFVINLKTAKTLGLDVPPLSARARRRGDRVRSRAASSSPCSAARRRRGRWRRGRSSTDADRRLPRGLSAADRPDLTDTPFGKA